jgi:FkbM family methyltransferase
MPAADEAAGQPRPVLATPPSPPALPSPLPSPPQAPLPPGHAELAAWLDATAQALAALRRLAVAWARAAAAHVWAQSVEGARSLTGGAAAAVTAAAAATAAAAGTPRAAGSPGALLSPRFVPAVLSARLGGGRLAALLLAAVAVLAFSAGMSVGSAGSLGGRFRAPAGAAGGGWRGLAARTRDDGGGAVARAWRARQRHASGGGGDDGGGDAFFLHIPPAERVPCDTMRSLRDALVAHLYRGMLYARLGHLHLDTETLLPLVGGFDQAPDALFVDVGANVGMTSAAIMRHLCSSADAAPAAGGAVQCSAAHAPCARRRTRVLAFEPAAAARAALVANASSGRWGECGWEVRPQALAHAAGAVTLYGRGTQASLAAAGARGTAARDAATGAARGQQVDATTLDAVLAESGWAAGPPGSLFLLKVDAEGFDPLVLAGAAATLAAALPRLLLFEYNVKWRLLGANVTSGGGGGGGGGGGVPSPLEAFAPGGVLSLRSVTRALFEHFHYACYLYTPRVLVPLSGAWWTPPLEFYRWSNVLCAREDDVALLQALLTRLGGQPLPPALPEWTGFLPPYSRCHVRVNGGGGGGGGGGGPAPGASPSPAQSPAHPKPRHPAGPGQRPSGRPRLRAGGGGSEGAWTLPAAEPGEAGSFEAASDWDVSSSALGGDAPAGTYRVEDAPPDGEDGRR